MRAQHSPHPLRAFPVYSAAFISPNHFVLGGGGGASKTGIKNKLRLYSVDNERSISMVNELELEVGEDVPMSMAADTETKTIVCGVNSALEKLEKGENQNCRAFVVKDNKLQLQKSQGTLDPSDLEDYQKVTVISPDRTKLAVAGSHTLSVLSFPSLTPIAGPITSEKEIYDVTFSPSSHHLVIATTQNLLVYILQEEGSNKDFSLELSQTIRIPESLSTVGDCTFRAARFHPQEKSLYTVVNAVSSRSRKAKSVSRQAYICKWDTNSWVMDKNKKASDRGLTCFDISACGRFLALGSSDLSISILDSNTLAPLISILKAHEFPPTTIKFNPTSTLLLTGSADNSIRIVSIPLAIESSSWGVMFLVIVAFVILLLAIALQKHFQ
ncbi:hypothetical protein AMATHDRAFT_74010 [Amanita thiersii Skay4041]|uniref:Uncharacterized protein n=1 Tax=Amanita thiersii Skay4041 TaxID=703135 RepID=A0A2A9NXL6_9AGAR|nr:hypothetical protein AMATHDRAFT_74010 [Amanita thiersii Skay4041]